MDVDFVQYNYKLKLFEAANNYIIFLPLNYWWLIIQIKKKGKPIKTTLPNWYVVDLIFYVVKQMFDRFSSSMNRLFIPWLPAQVP